MKEVCPVRHTLSLSIALLLPVSAAFAAPLTFTDQTAAAGLDFAHAFTNDHQSGPMVGGGAVGDFNGDGYPDLFVLASGGRSDALYINNTDGTFTDHAQSWGLSERHRGVGATVADYDGDGDDDLYVTSFGVMGENSSPGRHRLYRNDGGRFVDVAVAAGVATTATTHPDGYGASFGDYDLDGDLDLFVGAWHAAPVLHARLFRNDGDGTFSDMTQAARVITGSTRAFGAQFVDMDGDRYPEILVAGDFGTSRYYRNNKNGTFDELDPGTGNVIAPEPPTWSINKVHNAMGTTLGDFNRDGRPDWFVTAIWPTAAFDSDFWGNGLYINQGGHKFAEAAQAMGVHDGGWGWGTEASDFDHDGWTDLVMTNGWQFADPVTGEGFDGERSYLWRNNGDLTFSEVTDGPGLKHTGQGRALMTLDYDRDGDMDILIVSNKEPLQLFRNELIQDATPDDAHWLQIKLDTARSGDHAPHGMGAIVTLVAGGVTQIKQVVGGASYLGHSEMVTHFGLGSATKIQRLSVEWADGKTRILRGVGINQRLTVVRGEDGPARSRLVRPANRDSRTAKPLR
ncbi:MAG: FG-GAP-like repeat-containing protein [Gammaproteobacteria bacterium]